MTSAVRPRTSTGTARTGTGVRAVAGGVLVALGLVLWILYRVAAGNEAHSYAPGTPQGYVSLEQGHRYWIGVPGGVTQLRRETSSDLRCSVVTRDGRAFNQPLTTEGASTKATNAVASFQSTIGGPAKLSCSGVFDAYIDNATGDPSGWALLGATLLLTVGAPLLLSAGYTRWSTPVRSSRVA